MNAQVLTVVIGMTSAGMRTKTIGAGFTSMNDCSELDSTYVHQACQTVRKTEGDAATKEITMAMEHRLIMLCVYARYQYITDSDMTHAHCTRVLCKHVYDWKKSLAEDPDEGTVKDFTEGANKKIWFESIRGYFSVKKGKTGFPLVYVIREADDPIDPAPAWGTPTMDVYLETQGRHDGRLYASDNTAVWLLLRQKCHGTTAWNCIRSFETRRNGRGAYKALISQYMGRSVTTLLLKRAETTLETLYFDGKNKNWTWDKFIGRYREALDDLGPDNQISEERKVIKLMSAFQVPNLAHCEAIVFNDPRLAGSLNEAITFLGSQMTASEMKNGMMTRALATVATTVDEEILPDGEEITEDSFEEQLKALRHKLKVLEDQARARRAGSDKAEDKPPAKSTPASAADPVQEEPTRKIGALDTSGDSASVDKPDAPDAKRLRTVTGIKVQSTKPRDVGPGVNGLPPSVLKSPPLKSFTISQRPLAYAKKS